MNREALLALQEELDRLPGVGVALSAQTLARVSDQLDVGYKLVRALVLGMAVIVLLSMLVSVYGSALSIVGDVAVMRVMGAGRLASAMVVFGANAMVVAVGCAAGLAGAAMVGAGAERSLGAGLGVSIHVSVLSPGLLAYLLVAAFSLALVGLLPAAAAYRVEAAEALADLPGSGRTVKSTLAAGVKAAVSVVLVLWFANSGGAEIREFKAPAVDQGSIEVFHRLAHADRSELEAMNGKEITIQGFMYTLEDMFEVKDFYLVSMDPSLPRCPFCYKAPTARDRIKVLTAGRTFEVYKGPVQVRGKFKVDLDAADPFTLDLEDLVVVVP